MSYYEIIIACIAGTNLALTLMALNAARFKAGTIRIDSLEENMRLQLKGHDALLMRLAATVERSLTQDHLTEVYRDLKSYSQQVHILIGQQSQMNENLRLLLSQMVRDREAR